MQSAHAQVSVKQPPLQLQNPGGYGERRRPDLRQDRRFQARQTTPPRETAPPQAGPLRQQRLVLLDLDPTSPPHHHPKAKNAAHTWLHGFLNWLQENELTNLN